MIFRSLIGKVLKAGWVSLVLLAVTDLRAAVPVLDHVFPAALQIGSTQSVTLVGKFDPWPTRLDLDIPGVTWEATTNTGVITVRVSPKAPVGPQVIRAFSPEGVSAPRFLILSSHPQRAEVEPNDEMRTAQALSDLPAEVNGRLEKNGDVDSYSVELQAGQTLVARLEAYTLQSPLDPVLRLLDAQGVQVAWNHDEVRSLDPLLAWRAPKAGTYVLQVFGFAYPADSDLRFSGSAKSVYRLHVSTDPVARHGWPLGVSRSVETRVRWGDWGVPEMSSESTLVPSSAIASGTVGHSCKSRVIGCPWRCRSAMGRSGWKSNPMTQSPPLRRWRSPRRCPAIWIVRVTKIATGFRPGRGSAAFGGASGGFGFPLGCLAEGRGCHW